MLPVLFLLSFGIVNGAKATVVMNQENEKYPIYKNMEILEDREGILSIDDVSSPSFSSQFQPNDDGIPSYGYTSSVYWMRFEIDNRFQADEYILEFPYAPHDSITLYEPNGTNGYKASNGGDLLPFANRDLNHRHVTFELSLPEKESRSFYVKIQSQGSLQLPIILWTGEAFSEKSLIEYLLFGLYYGATLVMAVYNVFLYSSLRLRSYLWYVFLIMAVSMTQLTLNGFAYQFLWPDFPWWNNRSIVFSIAISNLAGAIFVNKFLEVRQYTRVWSRILSVLAVFNIGVIGVLMVSYPLALNLVTLSTIFFIPVVLTTTILCWKRGNKAARFLFLAWFIFLLTGLISSLSDAGMLPLNTFTRNASLMGSLVEMILFSLALADQVKIIQLEKEKAERMALETKEMALEHLKRTDRLKDEFLANTTHELRTPLYGMIGIAESLRDGVAGEPNTVLTYNLSLIIKSGRRLANLINDLLDYSKLKSHEIKLDIRPVRLQDAANLVMTIIEPLTRNKDVQLVNQIPTDLPFTQADENRVQQILHNLIGNAVKFTDVGCVTITAEIEKEMCRVKIMDTGIGMSLEDMESAFNEFEQGGYARSRQKSGTGLGLSITKNLVELHGGEIFLDSELGKGTTVVFTLPIYQEDVTEVPTISPYYEAHPIDQVTKGTIPTATQSVKGKILIADDDPVNIQVLSNHLHLNGYELVVAEDGEQVLTIIRRDPSFDLVILDLMMPKLSGYEVCKQLRVDFSLTELPVLILTAKSQLKDVVTAFQEGANDYLIKPYLKEELLARVATLLTLKKVMEEMLEKSQQLNLLNEKLEERVQKRTEELQDSTEKLFLMERSRRHLLSNISHDLGTPMTSIQGYVKAMLDGVIEPGDRSYLGIIYEKTLYIDRLIQDLHDLSRLESGQASFYMKEVSIQWFIQFLHEYKMDINRRNISFQLNTSIPLNEGPIVLYLDKDRIRQVMDNLISNAIKYTKENGLITVEVITFEDFYKKCKDRQGYLEEIAVAIEKKVKSYYGQSLVIGVHDNGKGIDSEVLPFIFDRFYRADTETYDTYRNAGLGLAISKEIIDYHSGIIWAKSLESEGSSFYFTLPMFTGELEEIT
jgi:two-component system, sensor histidine kinase LadS